MRLVFIAFVAAISALASPNLVRAQELQLAHLGDFKLESGQVVRDCRIGYRTFGTLNKDRSNAVLFTTWASGTSEQLTSNFGPGGLVDTSKFFVIAVDALSNGVSSSPSNSRLQPRMKFPKFTMRDMVNTQHELLVRVLHIDHLRAVMGVSMGGMQAFQWVVSYPDFMDKAVPMAGSPQLAPYDLIVWQSQVDAIVNHKDWNNGNYKVSPSRVLDAEFGDLVLSTPEAYNRSTTRAGVFEELAKAKRTPGTDANNKIRQAEAMLSLDVAAPYGGSLELAAKTVKAKLFVIVTSTDMTVTPGPALVFAKMVSAEVLELTNNCGHRGMNCEQDRVTTAVREFLDR